ncbi:P83/100 family protein [Treponema pedis]|uniref:P83/100 family protein n=1 Tax=Treponema pedis TaxID=409322 RepID=UPI0031340A56
MKKLLVFCLFLTAVFSAAAAIEVDRPEIDTVKNRVIEFINYTGEHDTVDSVETIRAIGSALGPAVRQGRAGDTEKYAVIHCVDPAVKTGFDADIFIIGKNAGVDHINNLRLMIAGYLSAAYGYSQKDAATIAHFVTVYNAVYRSNFSYFKEKYKQVVLNNLTAEKAGIALRYDQWPGQTQIVIPLTDQKYSGTLSSVDTSSISDKNVVEKMRESDDKEIAARKDMVDLKERESGEAEKRAEEIKKEAAEKKKEAATQQKEADKQKKEAATQQKEADKKQKEADSAKAKAEKTGDEKDKAAADKKQAEADKAKEQADKEQAEADKAKDEADKKADEAKDEQEMADKKADEAQEDRKDIASDTQKIVEEKKAEKKAEGDAAIASAIPGYGLKVVDEAKLLSELVLLDLKTENELKTSSIATIRGRSLYVVGKNLLAIAGTESGNGVIALVLIDSKSLEIVKQSGENIAADSVLIKNGDDYYAVINNGGKYNLGRYNDKLELQAKSAIQVLPYTPVTIGDKGLLVQDSSGAVRLLKLTDLTNIVVTE